MRLDDKTGTWLKGILWTLLVLNMAAIFLLSAQTAEESTKRSDPIVAAPQALVEQLDPAIAGSERVYIVLQFIVRKTAHLMEFACLAVWATGLLILYGAKRPYLFGWLFTALYAASDELHQMFVPGREGKVMDWLIDSAGAALGALAVWALYKILRKRAPKKRID